MLCARCTHLRPQKMFNRIIKNAPYQQERATCQHRGSRSAHLCCIYVILAQNSKLTCRLHLTSRQSHSSQPAGVFSHHGTHATALAKKQNSSPRRNLLITMIATFSVVAACRPIFLHRRSRRYGSLRAQSLSTVR